MIVHEVIVTLKIRDDAPELGEGCRSTCPQAQLKGAARTVRDALKHGTAREALEDSLSAQRYSLRGWGVEGIGSNVVG